MSTNNSKLEGKRSSQILTSGQCSTYFSHQFPCHAMLKTSTWLSLFCFFIGLLWFFFFHCQLGILFGIIFWNDEKDLVLWFPIKWEKQIFQQLAVGEKDREKIYIIYLIIVTLRNSVIEKNLLHVIRTSIWGIKKK